MPTVVGGASQEFCIPRLGLGLARRNSAAVCSGSGRALRDHLRLLLMFCDSLGLYADHISQAREEIKFSSLGVGTACAVPAPQHHIRQNKTKLCFPANGAALISMCWKKDDSCGFVPWSAMSAGCSR